MFGACSAIVSITVSPNSSRFSSQFLPSSCTARTAQSTTSRVCPAAPPTDQSNSESPCRCKDGAKNVHTSLRRKRAPCIRRSAKSKSRRADARPRRAGFEVRQAIEREIHFSRRAAILVTLQDLRRNSSGKCSSPHLHERQTRIDARRNNVGVRSHRRFASTTPLAWPFFRRIFSIGASVRISTPASRAASAIAFEIAPVPPRENPHERNAPSISPM